MTIGSLRIRPLWVLVAVGVLAMLVAVVALRDVASRIDAADRRTPSPGAAAEPPSRFASTFSPGPKLGDLRDLIAGIPPERDEDEDANERDARADDSELGDTPEPTVAPPSPAGGGGDGGGDDGPRTPRTPRRPRSAG